MHNPLIFKIFINNSLSFLIILYNILRTLVITNILYIKNYYHILIYQKHIQYLTDFKQLKLNKYFLIFNIFLMQISRLIHFKYKQLLLILSYLLMLLKHVITKFHFFSRPLSICLH